MGLFLASTQTPRGGTLPEGVQRPHLQRDGRLVGRFGVSHSKGDLTGYSPTQFRVSAFRAQGFRVLGAWGFRVWGCGVKSKVCLRVKGISFLAETEQGYVPELCFKPFESYL